MKITFCTLFSLLQILKRFKATYSEKPQTNAIFMGKLVRYKQVSSMKLSYFSKFSSNNRICKFLNCNWPKLRTYESTDKSRTDGAFMGKQCL